MTATNPLERQTIGALERGVEVLLLFTRVEAGHLGVTEIAGQLDLPKAVVHRILNTLRASGLIDFDQLTRRYSLGPTALALGGAYQERINLRGFAREPMRRLVERTNETATLSIRAGSSRAYVDQITPAREVKMTVPLGRQIPLHVGGSSKTFLAFASENDRESYLATLAGVDAGQLRQQLASIRQQGYALSFGERQEGAGSVAAPVFDADGTVAAVMSVCGPLERFRETAGPASALLLMETSGLSRRLGYPIR
ncbi:IclR family transcriptional regulator [Solwaraspora sp. WMMB335]|uniref:IclR family transcriptional regulator n=1 Tax=Solwaraspora sp. WMMB335 TaxID=3404118 RepID=UPI003B937FA7